MNHPLRLMASLLTLAVADAFAKTPDSRSTPMVHQDGEIRIFYYTDGEDAVDATDVNQNGVPDQVEDAMTQTKAARMLYVGVLGFPDPFQSVRYRGVSFLDIRFRRKETLKSNGKAFDELRISKGARSFSIGLATSVKASTNPTPAHEFFHVIQNGATFFKNSWFTEGTARWSQRPFGSDGPDAARKLGEWPMSPEKSALLVAMSYEASAYFWKPLAVRYDAEGAIPKSELSDQLTAMVYADGTKVLKDLRLPGWQIVREVLRELDQADDIAFRELAYAEWSEENQRSPRNDDFILKAIAGAVKMREAAASHPR